LLPANFNGEILLNALHEAPDIEQKLGEEYVLDALYNIMINPRAFIQYQNDDDVMKVSHPIIQGLVTCKVSNSEDSVNAFKVHAKALEI